MRLGKLAIAALAASLLVGCGGGGGGNDSSLAVYIVTTNERLLKFELDSPDDIDLDVAITGLLPSEEIAGIDFRGADGQLFALGTSGQLYTINISTGAATLVGVGIGALSGNDFGVDFNNVVDRIRVISDTDVNFRINPNTGVLAGSDIAINPASDIVGAAYTPPAAGVTTLFAVDAGANSLVRIGSVGGTPDSPNTGIRTTIGPLGIDLAEETGFDIAEDGTAILATRVGVNTTNLFTVDLTDGGATFVGVVDGSFEVAAMAVQD